MTYQDDIAARFEKNATPEQRDFVSQVRNINDVLSHAVKEMIVLGLDVNGVKAKFRKIMDI